MQQLAPILIFKLVSENAYFPHIKVVSRRKSKDGQLVTVGGSIKDFCRRKLQIISCPQLKKKKNPKRNNNSKVKNPN